MKNYSILSMARGMILLSLSLSGFAIQMGCHNQPKDDTNTIVVWAMASKVEHWRADNAWDALQNLKNELHTQKIKSMSVLPINDPSPWGDYKKKFTMAADAGKGPDIVLSGHEDIAIWAQAGYIIPIADTLEELVTSHPTFKLVIERLWQACVWRGKIWAIPQDVESRPMYFSKTKLKHLGWSEAQITELPDKIKKGEFVLEDLIQTAQNAVKKGIVRPGYGYWHRPKIGGDFLQFYIAFDGRLYDYTSDKLVITQQALVDWFSFQRRCVTTGITPENFIGTEWRIWHDTVSHNKVLFWNGGSWNWADWAENYLSDVGGGAFLNEHVGYALIPSGIRGRPASTLSHPLVYMVTGKNVSGKNNQDISLHLLAKMTTAELNDRHALRSAHLGILHSQTYQLPLASDSNYEKLRLRKEFLQDVSYMLKYNYYLPNHALYSLYFDIVWENMLAAQNEEKGIEEIAKDTIRELQAELGEILIVE